MKLGLGTVQFGLDYGISNQEGKTPPEEVAQILDLAAAYHVRVLDTASLYGTSEEVLGSVLPPGHPFSIVTKTPRFAKAEITPGDASTLENIFRASLRKLRQPSVYGLLAHHADDLLAQNGELLYQKMLDLKRQGLVQKIGASVYTGAQIDLLLEKYSLDLVQLPVNVFDQRLLQGGQICRLKKAGVEIHARSIFLQGLLLMDSEQLPAYFNSVREHFQNYLRVITEYGMTRVEAAITFLESVAEIDTFVCGVNNRAHLQEILDSYSKVQRERSSLSPAFFARFALNDPAVLNPSEWKV